MKLLAFGDSHIKPVENAVDYDKLCLPPDIDAIVTVGDITHRTGPDDLAASREFFERLARFDWPVICVPGNHDPNQHYAVLTEGLTNVVNAHKQIVTNDTLGIDNDNTDNALAGHQFIGWGCEEFEFKPEVRLTDFPTLDPRAVPRRKRRHAADMAAQRLENALFELVTDELTADDVLSALDIDHEYRGAFETQLKRVLNIYDTLNELLARTTIPTIVLTHIPPYNTELDRHHSIGEREVDLEGLHTGSIGLKLALREHRPIAALSGHSHNGAYEPGDDGEKTDASGRPHMLNLDFRGIATVNIDGHRDSFGYTFHHNGV